MLTFALGMITLGSIGLGLYGWLGRSDLARRIGMLERRLAIRQKQAGDRIGKLEAELARLEPIRHIPDLIERGRRLDAEVADRREQAQRQAALIVAQATTDAESRRRAATAKLEQARQRAVVVLQGAEHDARQRTIELTQAAERDRQAGAAARSHAEAEAQHIITAARGEAGRIMADAGKQARQEIKEKTRQVTATLEQAVLAARDIRRGAEARAEAIGGQAYDALKRHNWYAAQALALKNRIDAYGSAYAVPADHALDDLAYDFGFHRSGERLKLARDRVKLMEQTGAAATCQYPDGWKKDYAIRFVLNAFNGQVDALLARIKPAHHGKLIQQIRDIFALTNQDGENFRNTRIEEEFLEARLDELKWGVAVQKVKEQEREEQRALKEQMREEEKAARERAKAVDQAERDQALIARALETAQRAADNASAQDRERHQAKLDELAGKLREAEEKNRRAVSMAQQTKSGHVYVISNVGSFGADVFKIGLTRRLEPLERVHELGGASVPFAFDVHAMIAAEDAPALEAALHRRFREHQVNKVNRRKEFFRVPLPAIRAALEEMKCDARWTLAAEARDYHDTRAMEDRMQVDPDFRRAWAESEAAYESQLARDNDPESDDVTPTRSTRTRAKRQPRLQQPQRKSAIAGAADRDAQAR